MSDRPRAYKCGGCGCMAPQDETVFRCTDCATKSERPMTHERKMAERHPLWHLLWHLLNQARADLEKERRLGDLYSSLYWFLDGILSSYDPSTGAQAVYILKEIGEWHKKLKPHVEQAKNPDPWDTVEKADKPVAVAKIIDPVGTVLKKEDQADAEV